MTSEKLYMLLCERAERASWELFAFLHSKHCRLPQSQFLVGKRDIEYGRFERRTSGRALNQREEYNGILRPSLKILHSKHCRLSQSRYIFGKRHPNNGRFERRTSGKALTRVKNVMVLYERA